MTNDEILTLHRQLVSIESISGNESGISDFIYNEIRKRGVTVEKLGLNIFATAGIGPPLLFNTHMDTVPPNESWTRDPWQVSVKDGKVYGLGANDTKGSLAAMLATLFSVSESGGHGELSLLVGVQEETGGDGTEKAWPILWQRGYRPQGVVVGEPTGLNIAIAQKGLLILKLVANGQACHAANADEIGAENPVWKLAGALQKLKKEIPVFEDSYLGRMTLQPTVLEGAKARNQVPGEAAAWLDLRTVPGASHDEIIQTIEALVPEVEVFVHSKRLRACGCDPEEEIVKAARDARPEAKLFGSRTMSDLVWFAEVPAIKVGPGVSERSHTADEFILESEILDGAEFYQQLTYRFAKSDSHKL